MHCKTYSERLLQGLNTLRQEELLCDLILVANKQPFFVHKAVMAASTDYFRALLTLDMREKSQDKITLKGVPAKGLKAVVDFAYTGHLNCNKDNISDILIAATHLQMTEAVQMCTNYLSSVTTFNNCVDMFSLAEQFQLLPLKDKTFSLILNNFDEISKSDEFPIFNEAFLGKILLDNRLKVQSELYLFHRVLKWINFNTSERSHYAYDLMKGIRFPLFKPEDLVESVMTQPLMKMNPHCLELVLEANKYHLLPHMQPVLQTDRTQVRTTVTSLVMLDIEEKGPKVLNLDSQSWGTLTNYAVETYHSQVCVKDNFLYVCGGIDLYTSNNPVSRKCYRYDPRFDSWTEIAPMNEARHHFTLLASDKAIYAIGGYCSGQYKNSVEKYVLATNLWVKQAPLEAPVTGAASASYVDLIYISGGQMERAISNQLTCYNIRTDSFSKKTPMLQPRMDHGMAVYKNQLLVFGGYNKNIIKAFDINTVDCYDFETDQWSTICDNSPKISGMHSCLLGPGVYTVGGFSYDDNKKISEIFCFNAETKTWHIVAKLPVPAMSVPFGPVMLPRNILKDVTV